MPLVQLLVARDAYARDLSALLAREGGFDVIRAKAPDFTRDGQIVADCAALKYYPALLDFPERLVLIAPNDAETLAQLWEHNVRSVVFESDSPATAVLAILSVAMRQSRALQNSSRVA
jgi:hypothetical protein